MSAPQLAPLVDPIPVRNIRWVVNMLAHLDLATQVGQLDNLGSSVVHQMCRIDTTISFKDFLGLCWW